ncbi:MAG: GH3 auxin-responsive promoter family protein [Rikenellaceae bacterium]
MMGLLNKITIGLIHKAVVSKGKAVMRNIEKISESPMSSQEEFLLQLLQDNKDTEFGKRYNFETIDSIQEYSKRVPVSKYDDYAADIERMAIKGEKNVLCAYPISHFSKSSGTMGNPKYIPYSDVTAKRSSPYTLPYIFAMLDKEGLLSPRKGISLVESVLTVLPTGSTYGAYSGKAIQDSKFVFENLNTPPVEVVIPKGRMNIRYMQSFYALKKKGLGVGMCAFYSYYLEVLRFIEKNWEMLADDIENGTFDKSIEIPADQREILEKKLKPDPKRAAEIREIFKSPVQPIVPQLWPNFKVVVGVGTASFRTYTEKLKIYFGPKIHFYMLGLAASEGIFSVPIKIDSGESVLVADSVFYEFLPEGSDDLSEICTLDKLEVGKNYELIITNLSGFYRYRMRDIIRVEGMYKNTPTIEFCYRADETVNLVGEKTTEYALREVVRKSAEECGIETVDYCMYPNADAEPVRYEFLVEPTSYLPDDFDTSALCEAINRNLAISNPSIGDKIARGIVGKSRLFMLQEETNLLYRDVMILKGTASAQLKPPRILDNPWRKEFFYRLIDDRY